MREKRKRKGRTIKSQRRRHEGRLVINRGRGGIEERAATERKSAKSSQVKEQSAKLLQASTQICDLQHVWRSTMAKITQSPGSMTATDCQPQQKEYSISITAATCKPEQKM